jgi:DNA-binding NarL/FixJ family response regulator
MTRIYIVFSVKYHAAVILDDPRPAREIMMRVNSQEERVGERQIRMTGKRQWAMVIPVINALSIVLEPPPVDLTYRQYEVLYGIYDGKHTIDIAAELGITMRTIYFHIDNLKERFGARSIFELVYLAEEFGMVEKKYPFIPAVLRVRSRPKLRSK